MAQGRKLMTSQSERFLGSYGYGNGYGYLNAADDSPELGEDDVWSIMDRAHQGERTVENSFASEWAPRAAVEDGPATGSRPIRRRCGGGGEAGGLSLAFNFPESSRRIDHQFGTVGSPRGGEMMATSAPVNVPEWSKIYRAESWQESENEGLEGEYAMVPPHEYLARGRSSGTMSVFEGVGRTLKGRDLRRVRDAVWSQTGFDG